MREPSGQPILFEDPATGEMYEGWDPTQTDGLGNQVGEPTAETHGVLFFDHDGDLDLWLADDGDRLKVLRNDTTPGDIRFTSIESEMGIDLVGSWMGHAVGDYDGDLDLDIFVTNIGYHPLLRSPLPNPQGECMYHQRFPMGHVSEFPTPERRDQGRTRFGYDREFRRGSGHDDRGSQSLHAPGLPGCVEDPSCSKAAVGARRVRFRLWGDFFRLR